MKKNSSIQVLIILMAAMLLITVPVTAAPPKPTAVMTGNSATNRIKTATGLTEAVKYGNASDSLLIISGKIDLGGADYYEATLDLVYKNVPGKPIDRYHITQKKSNEAGGYKIIVVIPGTGTSPKTWKAFTDWNQFEVTGGKVMVKQTSNSAWAFWDPTAPSLPKTYVIGPMQPK